MPAWSQCQHHPNSPQQGSCGGCWPCYLEPRMIQSLQTFNTTIFQSGRFTENRAKSWNQFLTSITLFSPEWIFHSRHWCQCESPRQTQNTFCPIVRFTPKVFPSGSMDTYGLHTHPTHATWWILMRSTGSTVIICFTNPLALRNSFASGKTGTKMVTFGERKILLRNRNRWKRFENILYRCP